MIDDYTTNEQFVKKSYSNMLLSWEKSFGIADMSDDTRNEEF